MIENDVRTDYLDEEQLRDRDVDPALIRILCPWATEFTGHDGQRCWAVADLASLWEGGQP